MAKSLTRGNPAKLIFGFAIPLLIGNLFQQVYNMADTLIVGRTIGVEALAAVGSTGSILFLLFGFLQAMANGFSIVTAQNFGARNKAGVRKSFCVSMTLCLLITLLVTAFSVVFARDILVWMRTPAELIDDAHRYMLILAWGVVAAVFFNLFASTILALGDSKTPLIFLVIACIVNILLDLLFILVVGMGVEGAALATVIAQVVAGVLCFLYIAKKQPILRVRRKDWKINGRDLWRTARIGLPMGFQMSVIALGAIILQVALNKLGPVSVAAYTVAQKIDLLATLPLMSFGLAMATYTGQNFGAGDIGRIRRGVKSCIAISLSFSVVGAMINIFLGHFLIRVFIGEGQDAVLGYAQTYLNINGSMYWVLALLFIFRNTLQGLGNSVVPTLAGVMELLMRAVAAIVLAEYFGFTGACFANPLAWLGSAIPLTIAYVIVIRKLAADPNIKRIDEESDTLAPSEEAT